MYLPLNLLGLNYTLTFLAVNSLLLFPQTVEGIHARDSTTQKTHTPSTVSVFLQTLRRSELAVADSVDNRHGVESQVAGIAKLAADCQVTENGINGALIVERDRGGFEMFGEFADAQDFARGAELLLHCIVGVNGRLGPVCAV